MNTRKITPLSPALPSRFKVKCYRLFHACFGFVGRAYLSKFFDHVEVTGIEHLKGSPKLVLMNHSCPLDPLLLTFYGQVPLQFLITETAMLGGFGAWVAKVFGQIPKRKLDYDPSSIKIMKQWIEAGASVALFPEGQFTWDGKPHPLVPGMNQLVQHLNVPVVTVRLVNGSKVRPAWATAYRKTRIRIEIDPPNEMFTPERLFSKSDVVLAPARGQHLSHGLKKLLRYCPQCFSENSLREENNHLSCRHCETTWDTSAESFSVSEILNRSIGHLDFKIKQDEVIESQSEVKLFEITRKEWTPLAEGTLIFQNGSLQIGDWQCEGQSIQAHTLDWGDRIIFRTKQGRFALHLPNDSRALWSHLLSKAMEKPVLKERSIHVEI